MTAICTSDFFPSARHDDPQPLMQPLEATPCRRALLADAGRLRISPELLAHHRREASRLRQATFRQAGRLLVDAIRRLFIGRAH